MIRGSLNAVKRLLDVSIAGSSLILLVPILCLIAVVVYVTMGPPVLFRQLRPGLGGRPFEIIKFRTMTGTAPEGEIAEGHIRRLSPIGAFLQRSSLDELPQLWNVLIGQMSLVGPRPLLMEYLPRYTSAQNRRHEVRPGLTGWAQVHGRKRLSWEDRLALDIWYVDHWSLWLDLRILAKTTWTVLHGEGATEIDVPAKAYWHAPEG
jgi:sugar transferase EpsL